MWPELKMQNAGMSHPHEAPLYHNGVEGVCYTGNIKKNIQVQTEQNEER